MIGEEALAAAREAQIRPDQPEALVEARIVVDVIHVHIHPFADDPSAVMIITPNGDGGYEVRLPDGESLEHPADLPALSALLAEWLS